jgi:hypothetical protein
MERAAKIRGIITGLSPIHCERPYGAKTDVHHLAYSRRRQPRHLWATRLARAGVPVRLILRDAARLAAIRRPAG